MPYYRRGYYRRGYGRTYRRWYGRRGWTRSWRGGMNRRILNGTRTFSMTVPVEGIYTAVIPANSYNTVVGAIEPFFYMPSNANSQLLEGSLVMSELYRTYSKLYDEVKIDWVSYELSVLDVIGQGGTFSACRMWTNVDRKFTRQDLEDAPTSYQVRTASSAQGVMMTNNSRTIIRRYVSASDLQERTCWHDCDVYEVTGAAAQFYDLAWYRANENVNFFAPALYYFMELNQAPAAQTAMNLSIKVKYGVTFRNAKYGLSAAANRSAGLDSDGVDRTGFEDLKKAAIEEVKDDADDMSDIVSKAPDTEVKPVKVGDVWYMQCSDGMLRPLEISGKDGSEVLDDDATIIEKKG